MEISIGHFRQEVKTVKVALVRVSYIGEKRKGDRKQFLRYKRRSRLEHCECSPYTLDLQFGGQLIAKKERPVNWTGLPPNSPLPRTNYTSKAIYRTIDLELRNPRRLRDERQIYRCPCHLHRQRDDNTCKRNRNSPRSIRKPQVRRERRGEVKIHTSRMKQ